jgi:cell division protein FtsB
MAKALFGHVGLAPDHRLVADMRRLQRRVAELEAEVAKLRDLNDALSAHMTVTDDMLLSVSDAAPALT